MKPTHLPQKSKALLPQLLRVADIRMYDLIETKLLARLRMIVQLLPQQFRLDRDFASYGILCFLYGFIDVVQCQHRARLYSYVTRWYAA